MSDGGISLELSALVVAIGSYFYTNYQSKRQRTAEIITTNRVEWMQQFKQYIAAYVGNLKHILESDKFDVDAEIVEVLNMLMK